VSILLVSICLCTAGGLGLSVAMFRRDDAFLGLTGLALLMLAGILGAVFAAVSSG
jgi:hypothetical protein